MKLETFQYVASKGWSIQKFPELDSEQTLDIEIIIADIGLGISSENLTRIFSFGFTTKPKGHGFGLHSSALFVKELGGVLQVKSEGIGHGATSIMTLPLDSILDRSEIHEGQV